MDVRIKQLENSIAKFSNKQSSQEAWIASLEQLNLDPPPEKLQQHSIQSNKDGISLELMNIAANAYQYHIRQKTMGGGSGSYLGYKIPLRMTLNPYARFEARVFADSIIFIGKSIFNLGSVQVTVNDTGRTGNWIFTRQFERNCTKKEFL